MTLTAVVSTACFVVARAVFLAVDADDLLRQPAGSINYTDRADE